MRILSLIVALGVLQWMPLPVMADDSEEVKQSTGKRGGGKKFPPMAERQPAPKWMKGERKAPPKEESSESNEDTTSSSSR